MDARHYQYPIPASPALLHDDVALEADAPQLTDRPMSITSIYRFAQAPP